MKVVLIYRKRRPTAHSIEELFHTIAGELIKHAEVIEYECGTRWSIFRDAWRLGKMGADVYHVTGDIHYMVMLLPQAKTVLTVHDICNYSRQLKGVKRWLFGWLWLKFPIRRARVVTVISEETRKGIQNIPGIRDMNNVQIVSNCISPVFRPSEKCFNDKQPVILQIGTARNKNLPRVVEALSGTHCRLSIVGPLTEEMVGKLHDSGLPYENHVNLDREEISQKYAEADIVCFASLYEGFGMPIIEANATGRVVITSDMEPMRSVAGSAACLVNPESAESIREGVTRVIGDASYREALIKNGFLNAEKYAPHATASRYFEIYKGLI